jgi:hypothetical protein
VNAVPLIRQRVQKQRAPARADHDSPVAHHRIHAHRLLLFLCGSHRSIPGMPVVEAVHEMATWSLPEIRHRPAASRAGESAAIGMRMCRPGDYRLSLDAAARIDEHDGVNGRLDD